MDYTPKRRLTKDQYIKGILSGDKIILSKAITLIESRLHQDEILAGEILDHILLKTGHSSIRVGITGIPGVGKSTFIEALGKYIVSLKKKMAVLSIDPTSRKSKGSILGDKTRMQMLANEPLVYIRPSPSRDSLGGVASKTREAMLLCEAAGYEVVLIETVGVGQSEVAVHSMVDFFLLLVIAGAGDELQGMKRGILEIADAIVINKAEGENKKKAAKAKGMYQSALHQFPLKAGAWMPRALTTSALTEEGIREVWEMIEQYMQQVISSGFYKKRRSEQNLNWMHEVIKEALATHFYRDRTLKKKIQELEEKVISGEKAAINAANELLDSYFRNLNS